jgi:hypothetical protein
VITTPFPTDLLGWQLSGKEELGRPLMPKLTSITLDASRPRSRRHASRAVSTAGDTDPGAANKVATVEFADSRDYPMTSSLTRKLATKRQIIQRPWRRSIGSDGCAAPRLLGSVQVCAAAPLPSFLRDRRSNHGRWRPCTETGDSAHHSEPFVGHDIRVSAEQVRERVDPLDPGVTRVKIFICGDSSDRPENAARESVRFA